MTINEQNYVDTAETVILDLKNLKNKNGRPVPMVTTSKLRNLLAMTADIYNEIMNENGEKLSEEICGRIEYLRVRFLYEAGREESVKKLVERADILPALKNINGRKKGFLLFHRYIEALVAFHKFYGGRDN